MTAIAPDAAGSSGSTGAADTEPTLAEAFGELAQGLVESEEAGNAPAAPVTPAASTDAAPVAPAAPVTPVGETGKPGETGVPAAPADDSDPLAGSEPFKYSVDGQARTFEGGLVVPGQGAIFTADALPKLQDRLQQADRLVEQNRVLYQQTQDFERAGGMKAIDALTEEKAVLDAAGSALLKALSDEATLIELATNPAARQQLLKEVGFAAKDARYGARERMQQTVATHAANERTATEATTAIGNAVAQLAQKFPGLTADDVSAVRAHASRVQSAIVRPATPDEARAAGVRPGESIIDLPTLHHLLADRHTLRTQAAESARRAASTDRENAARLAAAAPTAGGARPANAPRPGAGKAAPQSPKTLDQMTSAELTRAMKTGKIFELIGADD